MDPLEIHLMPFVIAYAGKTDRCCRLHQGQ